MAGLLNNNPGNKRKNKVKRGGRKYKKYNSEILTMFSTNAAGLKCRLESFKDEIRKSNAAIFTIQESHFRKKGKLKINNYEIFEAIRKKQKGVLMIGVHKSFNPMLINEYSEDFELLSVEFKVRNKEVRVISGYGPQESWTENERMPFFIVLEKEIIKAQMDGKSVILEMDSNSKLGPEVIANDPHGQSPNGKVLCDIVTRHGLIVANGISDKCEGSITRRRVTKDTIEESIIDHVIISEDLVSELDSLKLMKSKNICSQNTQKRKQE